MKTRSLKESKEQVIQYILVEFTDDSGSLQSKLLEQPVVPGIDLSAISKKLSYIADCYLTDHNADFSLPITIMYNPMKKSVYGSLYEQTKRNLINKQQK